MSLGEISARHTTCKRHHTTQRENMDNADNQNSEDLQVATEDQQNHEQTVQNSQSLSSEDPQDRNWRFMRERQRDLEYQLKHQQEMNEKLLALAGNQNRVVQAPDELDELADDEFLPKGQVKKLVQKERESIKNEALAEVKHLLQQQEQAKFMDHLRAKFNDFDDVVNKETLALLEKNDPELALTISQTNDPYKIGVQSYKYIKALGLTAKIPDSRRAREVEKKIEKNAQTIPSPMAYDKRPMAQAFQDTEAERSQLYKEMMGFARQSGFSY